MAQLNNTAPVARITHLNGLTVCQTNDGTVVVPIQWDYVSWTPMTERFITALKATHFGKPATGYLVALTGVVSPMTGERFDRTRNQVFREAATQPAQITSCFPWPPIRRSSARPKRVTNNWSYSMPFIRLVAFLAGLALVSNLHAASPKPAENPAAAPALRAAHIH